MAVGALVVAGAAAVVDEAGAAVTTVRLAMAPVSDVLVSVARSTGDADVNVTGGANLIFTPSNWMVPQVVRLSANADADETNDTATIEVSATSLSTAPIRVTVLDLAGAPSGIFANGFE